MAVTVEYFSRKQGDDSREMSVGFIYGNRSTSTHEGRGMIVRDALEALRKHGNVVKTLFPYNREVPEICELFTKSFMELVPEAYGNRITSYYRLYTEEEIKTSLMKNGPVICAMEWYKDIKIKNGIMTTEQKSSSSNGHHCIVIYGWNENGWLIQNSWGSSWGNKGKAVMPYNIKINEIWGVIDEYSENKLQEELAHLYNENELLNRQIRNLHCDITEYMNRILALEKSLSETDDTTKQLLLELNQKILEKQNELRKTNEIIEEQWDKIQKLEEENLELKKPFATAFGKLIAKLINFIANTVRQYDKNNI